MEQQLLHIRDIERITGFTRCTLRKKWLKKTFPEPIKLSGGNLIWHVETIKEWIKENIKEPSNVQ